MKRYSYLGLMLITYFGYLSLRLWQYVPSKGLIKPFPLNPTQEIDSQTYLWLMCMYFLFMVFAFIIWMISPHLRLFFNAVFILQVLDFAEYFLMYNKHIAEVGGVHVDVANLRFVTLFGIIIYTFVKWKS